MPIASVGKRILGGLIDLFVLFVFSLLFGMMSGLGQTTLADGSVQTSIHNGPFILAALICFLLFALMEYYTGKTIGKYFVKTKVVTLDSQKINFVQALIRNLFRFIDGIALYLVGLIAILCSKKKQRLGDMVAKTIVVDAS